MGKSDKKKKGRSSAAGEMATAAPAAAEPRRPFWARPLFWLGGIVVAALGVALTNLLVEQFGEALEVVTETGQPVNVDFVGVSEMSGRSVVLPSDVAVDSDDVDSVNLMSIEEREEWFRSQKAAHPSSLFLRLALSGNRSDPVRIMDITPVGTCEKPADAGTLFEDPPAGGEDSIRLSFDLDSQDPIAMVSEDVNGEWVDRPYFADHTVSLANGEQQIFTIELSTEIATCAVELELEVLEGKEIVTQRVTDGGDPFRVTADLPRTAWKQVYVGGVSSCTGLFAPASETWLLEGVNDCW